MTPETRQHIEAIVETLISILDADDGDIDLEDGHDTEHDTAEWGIADSGGLEEYMQELSVMHHFEQRRHEQRDKAIRAAMRVG